MSKKYAKDYTLREMMIVAAARELKNGDKVLVGIGIPQLAAILAQRTHAPNLNIIYESGIFGSRPARLPLSIGDPTIVSGSAGVFSFFETFAYLLQRGYIDVGFIGAAQIDKYGNINTTVIGDYSKPKVRLPGSGGACAISSFAKKVIVITPHEKRRFVEKLDFLTSPGFLEGAGSREKIGLHGGGPSVVISTLGILRFDPKTGEMYLDSYHPGVTIDQVKEATSWDLKISPNVKETEPPTEEEIRILREEIDPMGIFLKK